jgi:PAS domain S-box-containing protein|uniref:histidine kinase n=1 Tax=Desulfobacca acetoxidans TaxID=60893 RepID=A0A7C3WME6_9BACT
MKTGLKIVLLALMTGILFWFFGSVLDHLLFYPSQSLWVRLLNIGPRGYLQIFLVIFLFLIYGLCIFKEVSDQAKMLKLFTDLINQSNDAIFIIDASTGEFKYFNDKALIGLKIDKKELAKKKFNEIDRVLQHASWNTFIQEIRQKPYMLYESHYIRKDGSAFPVEVNIKSAFHGGTEYLLAVCRDITERKRAEERYQTIIRTTKDGFFLTDSLGNFLDINEAYCRMTHYRHDELMQMNVFDLFEAREEIQQRFYRIAVLGSDIFEGRLRSKEGQSLLVEASVNYIPTAGGRYFGFLRDITERKQMEEALSAEKERLAVTLRSISEGVIATDTKGRVVLMNNVAEKLTGWEQEKAQGLPVSEVMHLIDQHAGIRGENPVQQVLQTGQPVNLPIHTILLARDGTERLLAASAAPIIDWHQQIIGAVMVFQDKTLERLTEREMLKIEKLSSLGLMAGGIAHDLNNVLAVILGNISLASLEVKDELTRKSLAEAEKAGLRARDLAKQLLVFARGGTPVKELVTIGEVIQDSAKLACAGTPVRCEVSAPPDLWPVEVDPGQISQVIQNLVINAVQAMPQGGEVRLSCENVILSKDNPLTLRPGNYLKIAVQDQGVGIWPDHLPKIFDPYFTTKQKGSGLGLATAYAIIKNHEGHITVDSTVGKGTTFFIYLPAAKKEYRPKPELTAEVRKGRGKILVMDDEEQIRTTMRLILEYLGYEAELVEDGGKALARYSAAKDAGQPFDAVIVDLTVPGSMGGRELIQRLRQVDPEVKALVFSGYADDPIMSHFEEFGFRGFIRKPYSIQDVSEALHKVLH